MALSRDDALNLLRDLVAIPSVSGQEQDAVAFLVDWMAKHGFRAYVDDVGNAIGVLDGGPSPDGGLPRDIVLLGHIDTVSGNIPVTLRDGKLYGRGAVDAKGPLAAFVAAATRVGPAPGWRVIVAGAVEEEAATSKGARHIAAGYQPACAVIGEPSGWDRLTLGYKGRLLAEATFRRPMSHRSGGDRTACEQAVAFWNRVDAGIAALNRSRERSWDQVIAALRGFSSADDGLYETARLAMGFRLPPDFGPAPLQEYLRAQADGAELSFSGPEAAYRGDKNTWLVRAFLRAVREQGGRPRFVLKTGTSDMNVVGPAWGCPILAYGPGDSGLDHTPQEHVSLAEWMSGVAVLTGALSALMIGR